MASKWSVHIHDFLIRVAIYFQIERPLSAANVADAAVCIFRCPVNLLPDPVAYDVFVVLFAAAQHYKMRTAFSIARITFIWWLPFPSPTANSKARFSESLHPKVSQTYFVVPKSRDGGRLGFSCFSTRLYRTAARHKKNNSLYIWGGVYSNLNDPLQVPSASPTIKKMKNKRVHRNNKNCSKNQ